MNDPNDPKARQHLSCAHSLTIKGDNDGIVVAFRRALRYPNDDGNRDRMRVVCVIHSRTPIRTAQKGGGQAYTPAEALADTFQHLYGQNAPAHKPTRHPIRWKQYPAALAF